MSDLSVIILAAGKGTRMGGDVPKVLVETDEGTLISHVIKTVKALNPKEIIVVTGYGREKVEASVSGVMFAYQKEQLGTGHAAMVGLEKVGSKKVLILYGDVPLIRPETLQCFISGAKPLSFISEIVSRDTSYGRVIRDSISGKVLGIKERKDCDSSEALINEVNSGLYLVDSEILKKALASISPKNAQGEYYLTDIVSYAVDSEIEVGTFTQYENGEFFGVNTLDELAEVNRILLERRIKNFERHGVIFRGSSYVAPTVTIGKNSIIGASVELLGSTSLGEGVVVESGSLIKNSKLHDDVTVKLSCRIEESELKKGASVGPFANLRAGTMLEEDVKIGNFVETKKAHLKRGAKASHLTYLGDCEVGVDANIGAGTITCNYDGFKKHKTVIEDGAFIGSNTALIAPVKVGKGAIIGAGSAITKDVPEDSLSLTRAEQKVIPDWAKKFRERN